jgi:hypothetical protein
MGTNYYVKKEENQDIKDAIHIGKRSGGWQFLLSPFRKSGKAWINFLKRNKDLIYNEYGEKIYLKEMLENIDLNGYFGKDKMNGKKATPYEYNGDWKKYEFYDKEGYRISKYKDFC